MKLWVFFVSVCINIFLFVYNTAWKILFHKRSVFCTAVIFLGWVIEAVPPRPASSPQSVEFLPPQQQHNLSIPNSIQPWELALKNALSVWHCHVPAAATSPSKSEFSAQLYKITDFSAAQPYSVNPGKKSHFLSGFWVLREKGIFHELPFISSARCHFHLIHTNYSKYSSSFYFFASPLKIKFKINTVLLQDIISIPLSLLQTSD